MWSYSKGHTERVIQQRSLRVMQHSGQTAKGHTEEVTQKGSDSRDHTGFDHAAKGNTAEVTQGHTAFRSHSKGSYSRNHTESYNIWVTQ